MLRIIVVLAVLGIAVFSFGGTRGCTGDDPEGVIPESYQRSLDKAKGVEDTLRDGALRQLEPESVPTEPGD